MHPRDLPLPSLDLAALKLPRKPKVRRIVIEPYVDHNGMDELLVWILFEDSTTDRDFMSPAILEVERVIWDAVMATGDTRFPYTQLIRNKEFRYRRRAS